MAFVEGLEARNFGNAAERPRDLGESRRIAIPRDEPKQTHSELVGGENWLDFHPCLFGRGPFEFTERGSHSCEGRGGLNHVPWMTQALNCSCTVALGLVFGLRSASFHFRCAPETGLKCDASRGDRGRGGLLPAVPPSRRSSRTRRIRQGRPHRFPGPPGDPYGCNSPRHWRPAGYRWAHRTRFEQRDVSPP